MLVIIDLLFHIYKLHGILAARLKKLLDQIKDKKRTIHGREKRKADEKIEMSIFSDTGIVMLWLVDLPLIYSNLLIHCERILQLLIVIIFLRSHFASSTVSFS